MSEMWKREEFLIANGMSQLPNSSMTNDLSPYDYFDGGLDTDIDMDFSELRGRRRRRPNQPKRRVRKAVKNTQERFSNRRTQKSSERQKNLELQRKAIEEVNKVSEADAKILSQLTQTPTAPVTPEVKGMTKGTKTALIISGVAVLSFVGFMLYKKFKK